MSAPPDIRYFGLAPMAYLTPGISSQEAFSQRFAYLNNMMLEATEEIPAPAVYRASHGFFAGWAYGLELLRVAGQLSGWWISECSEQQQQRCEQLSSASSTLARCGKSHRWCLGGKTSR